MYIYIYINIIIDVEISCIHKSIRIECTHDINLYKQTKQNAEANDDGNDEIDDARGEQLRLNN